MSATRSIRARSMRLLSNADKAVRLVHAAQACDEPRLGRLFLMQLVEHDLRCPTCRHSFDQVSESRLDQGELPLVGELGRVIAPYHLFLWAW